MATQRQIAMLDKLAKRAYDAEGNDLFYSLPECMSERQKTHAELTNPEVDRVKQAYEKAIHALRCSRCGQRTEGDSQASQRTGDHFHVTYYHDGEDAVTGPACGLS